MIYNQALFIALMHLLLPNGDNDVVFFSKPHL